MNFRKKSWSHTNNKPLWIFTKTGKRRFVFRSDRARNNFYQKARRKRNFVGASFTYNLYTDHQLDSFVEW
jgi:hypothetical protein